MIKFLKIKFKTKKTKVFSQLSDYQYLKIYFLILK